jgi:hypothetical protein
MPAAGLAVTQRSAPVQVENIAGVAINPTKQRTEHVELPKESKKEPERDMRTVQGTRKPAPPLCIASPKSVPPPSQKVAPQSNAGPRNVPPPSPAVQAHHGHMGSSNAPPSGSKNIAAKPEQKHGTHSSVAQPQISTSRAPAAGPKVWTWFDCKYSPLLATGETVTVVFSWALNKYQVTAMPDHSVAERVQAKVYQYIQERKLQLVPYKFLADYEYYFVSHLKCMSTLITRSGKNAEEKTALGRNGSGTIQRRVLSRTSDCSWRKSVHLVVR